ncbi:Lipoma-preferred partner-like protein [Frankliniella fusca]|uniref:Lipoma-preferred partner-like protein n=1 Tax=Frankliniella fusca TaxID=407009 RepID=A0AAE1H5P2_9NEOP|nr:Lipoma-preferred partner-like protein [Frankliniella fusca]
MASHLEHQLAGLQIGHGETNNAGSGTSSAVHGSPNRKIGPAVPPKPSKKSQPLVPKSYSLNGPCEPSYSIPLQSGGSTSPEKSNVPLYTNLPHTQNSVVHSRMNNTATYSNLPEVQGQALYSNTYSNYPSYPQVNRAPRGTTGSSPAPVSELPPPPPEPNAQPPEDGPETLPDDLPPPPSPVSSSYSELRRATYQPGYQPSYPPSFPSNYPPDYSTYGSSSQSSSTYESIYEPINPRPPSQLSSRSNYSLYAPYSGSQQGTLQRGGHGSAHNEKEAEVDALTDLLVQSMDGSTDSDVYGICTKCGEKVVGEGSGCTAMDQVYHIRCFTCCDCAVQLQGKPFYALEGKPYCKEDYLNTLEKCSVCLQPILDRILRATGRPYHPQCFCCVVCGESLDGIPFTVDATNQIHCIQDFHKKFAPRCCVCKLPIMPEAGQDETVRVVALDRSFHIQCYKCEDCGLVLSTEAEGRGCYPLDDHVLCKSCNAKRVQALTSHMTTEL